MVIEIRELGSRDVISTVQLCAEIRNFHIKLLNGYFKPQDDEFEKEYLEKLIEDKNSICLIAVAGEQVIGLLFAERKNASYLVSPDICNIHNFGVAECCRKQGVGKKLMDEFCRVAKKNGIDEVKLGVCLNNKDAVYFYKKYGFKPIEQKMSLNIS